MAEEKLGIVVSELGKSLIMPSVTVEVPMPSGVATPALSASPHAAPSSIMPSVTANIHMPSGAAVPAHSTQPQNIPAQAPADSSNGNR